MGIIKDLEIQSWFNQYLKYKYRNFKIYVRRKHKQNTKNKVCNRI